MITLSPTELLPTRPFTHPDHTSGDLKTLLYMLDQVSAFLDMNRSHDHLQHPILLHEPDGRAHRYFIPNPKPLIEARDLAVVGFFGHKRPDANPNHFGGLGEAIMGKIPSCRDILGYSNMALDGENFSNLVLLRDETVKQLWMESEAHSEAVNRSPGYYATVRIYNGTLAGGVTSPGTLCLRKVKYYDFESNPPWRGERNL